MDFVLSRIKVLTCGVLYRLRPAQTLRTSCFQAPPGLLRSCPGKDPAERLGQTAERQGEVFIRGFEMLPIQVTLQLP